jgi:hypothetical protein
MQYVINRLVFIIAQSPTYSSYKSHEELRDHLLSTYMNIMKDAPQKSHTRSYPVAQSKAWINDNNSLNISGLWHDLYALIKMVMVCLFLL